MVDERRENSGKPHDPATPSVRPRWRVRLLVALVLVAAAAALVAYWPGLLGRANPGPLEGELRLFVQAAGKDAVNYAIEEAGAVPVRAGHEMNMELRFNQPAYSYVVWLDCQAQAVPLYPWNNDSLQVKDIAQPPPLRKPAQFIFSPNVLGGGWKIGRPGGMETVLLLARRTPIGEETRLGALLSPLPPVAKMRRPDEVSLLALDRGADAISELLALNRGSEDEARAAEEPLRTLLLRLRDHFELIRAVRFAHVAE